MMVHKRIRTWEEAQALPKGKWIEVDGMDIVFVKAPRPRRRVRVVIPLDPKVARTIAPNSSEVLEAKLAGRNLELVRRRRTRAP